ncbi:neuropeptides capa receptor-like isoform X1 [Cataglyphis hispanica]|uniref:neuropeptides capa receptor-like isoform X1 n=1 Tax=Cataglyphis hispanica TaxID=1086592 RepID=UPI00217FEF3B|nr:neuropeptides capa receptor-like isoform X1 [Cataglyphis hispanica]
MEFFHQNISIIDNITELNLSESEYLNLMWGPKHLPLKVVLPITLIYVMIFVTGVFGNVVTCIVIKRNPALQTATNYYLFNLAISDLLLLILGLPNELSVFWKQYPWTLGEGLCKIRAYVSEMSSYVSVLTIVVFSLERYLAICHPLHLYAMSGLKRPVRFIVGAWLLALIFALPFAVYTTVNYIEYPPKSGRYSEESAMCAMLLPNMPKFPLYELSCLIFFLVPMLSIAVLYVRMGLRIQSNGLGHSIEGSVHGETRQAQSRKAIIRMLSAVVITFFICWAPFHAQRLMYVYQVSAFEVINEWLYPLGGCLYYFSTTANPILYNVMSAKYRMAFKKTLRCTPTSPTITRDDLSSMRDSTVCGCGSRRGSQVVRIRSVHYQRSIKCNMSHANEMLRSSMRLRYDDEDDEAGNCGAERSCDILNPDTRLRDTRRSSFLAHSRNGRTKYLSNEKTKDGVAQMTAANETCI